MIIDDENPAHSPTHTQTQLGKAIKFKVHKMIMKDRLIFRIDQRQSAPEELRAVCWIMEEAALRQVLKNRYFPLDLVNVVWFRTYYKIKI